jgi:hypothetical protein
LFIPRLRPSRLDGTGPKAAASTPLTMLHRPYPVSSLWAARVPVTVPGQLRSPSQADELPPASRHGPPISHSLCSDHRCSTRRAGDAIARAPRPVWDSVSTRGADTAAARTTFTTSCPPTHATSSATSPPTCIGPLTTRACSVSSRHHDHLPASCPDYTALYCAAVPAATGSSSIPL